MRQKIYVLSHGTKWRVKCEHCNEAVVSTKAEAVETARQHVSSNPEGTLAQILVQGQDGRWLTEWTYGQDPYPPKG